jgi:DNA-binding LacI/PurR family transcriptional regulator
VARSLARGRTGSIGIVVPDIANSFSAVITKAVQQEARRDGYALFVAGSEEIAQDEERWARAMAAQVDGLLLVSPQMPDDALLELAEITPVVFTNRLLDGIPAVLTDAYEATGHAVEHLHALGHRNWSTSRARTATPTRSGCGGSATPAAGWGSPRRARPLPCPVLGRSAGGDLVLATSATGVVAYNDEVAVGVINRLADRGVRVPEDMSVVGFDDTQLAEMVMPRLTTVRIPAAAAGAAAVGMLLDVVAGRDSGPSRSPPAPGELVVRASTGPVPARRGRGGRGHDGHRPSATRLPPSGARGSCRCCGRPVSSRSPTSPATSGSRR